VKVRIQEKKLMKINENKSKIMEIMEIMENTRKNMIIKAYIIFLIRSGYIDTKLNHTDFIRRTTNLFFIEKLFDALLYLRKYG
jgi:hypothetical protein